MNWRFRFGFIVLLIGFTAIAGRLFYWQIIKGKELYALAQSQYGSLLKIQPRRGEIEAKDGFPIATNKVSYLVFANPKEVKNKDKASELLSNIMDMDIASISVQLSFDKLWVPLNPPIDSVKKEVIENLDLLGVGFEEKYVRFYPEASMSAHVLGFVGKDDQGNDKGYFGLEGYYDKLLRGKESYALNVQDALGKPILTKLSKDNTQTDGSDLILSIERPIQYAVEKKLKNGVEKYKASSGMTAVINPKTGEIIAMASYQTFEPGDYPNYSEDLYKNPFISSTYEPGSTLKPIIMASAIDAGIITPQTKCNICEGPVSVSGYELHTWNDKY